MNIHARLSGLDLNLLVVLDALLDERNVTRAAARLGLSQPAASNALARLRQMLDDPLLVRSAGGMVPTRRALDLRAPVHDILERVEGVMAPSPTFDPARSGRTFTLATTDYVELVLLPRVMDRLQREAPGVSLEVRPQGRSLPARELESGDLDLALGYFPEVPAPCEHQELFEERFACLVRRGHPGAGARLTLERFVVLNHVLVSPRGGRSGVVDDLLAARGLRRRVTLTVPHFLVAPLVVDRTDLVVTLAERVALLFCELLPLDVLPPPLDLPGFAISMVWHGRSTRDPASRWLRDLLAAVSQELPPPLPNAT